MRLYLGDTIVLNQTLTDAAGLPVDLTGASVVAVFSNSETLGGPATIEDPPTAGVVSFSQIATDAGMFQVRWVATVGGLVTTHLGPAVRVMDPDAMWATPADVIAIIGPQEDMEAVYRALDAAQVLIASWICVDPGAPLPPAFTLATALVAARLVESPAPTDPVAETIGDYSYRLATAPNGAALRGEVRHLLGPWLCGNLHSPRVWPDPNAVLLSDCLPEFQPDAEGFLRS